jgi:hypothetical protein
MHCLYQHSCAKRGDSSGCCGGVKVVKVIKAQNGISAAVNMLEEEERRKYKNRNINFNIRTRKLIA